MNAEEYKTKLSDYFYGSCAGISVALAKQTGLLDVFYATNSPLTISEIAERNNSKDRYIKELLGSLVSAGVVEISDDSTQFHVPEEHKKHLQEYSVLCAFPTAFAERFNALTECFKKDGPYGINYSQSTSVCKLIGENKNCEGIIENQLLPAVPGLKEKLDSGIDVLELGCNTGLVLIGLATRFPKSRFLGGDVVETSIETGRDMASSLNLKNIEFEVLDIMDLPTDFSDKYDWCFVQDVIHDLPKPDKGLSELYRCLKRGQVFSMIECTVPGSMAQHANNLHACYYYTASTFMCLPSSFQQADSAAAGAMWGADNVRKALYKAGFKIINETVSESDEFITHFVCQK
ncbi:uncharacterized protein LOC121371375 [Gigantopelta aegis]|uniref:uncharacterized protein LOC121371375 n=1 Tax=Gigantopelta aegis TaxID=1735272 RepID=UPI001B88CBFA|nr:uncharacterized protein LOC121371375 [Gigantopelta aegis]